MKREKKLLLLLVLVLVGALLFSVVPASAGENPDRGKSLAEARKTLEQDLLPLAGAGFVGIAHSEAEGEVIVFVEDEQTKQRVPRSFNGHTVRTEVTGKIQALSTQVAEPLAGVSPVRRQAVRPLVGGISLSAHIPNVYYAGTLGIVTYDDKILSNAHVIAMHPVTYDFLALGTPVIQPGYGDGGRLGAKVGELENYIPIDFDPAAENYADAAIGSIDGGVGASYGEQFGEGGNYWVEGWTEVSIGDTIRKSGRTTGVTTGEVDQTNGSVYVWYGDQLAHFVDQIIVEQENWSFLAPGDSGSAVDKDGEFVGLVFAGSEDYAFINKAEHIIDGLGIAVEPLGNSLTISSTEGGEVTDPGEGMFICDADEVVDLEAVPDPYYHFVEWTGDVGTIADVEDPTTTITMDDSYSITANFALNPGYYSLTISSTPGGSVTTPDEGTFVYEADYVVDLDAEHDEYYHFDNWTGDVSTIADVEAASTNITMNDSYSITANFELDPGYYSLTISSTEGGSVITPNEGIFVYEADYVVDLVAENYTHYHFAGWTGDVGTIADVEAATTTITMNASYSITANFALDPGYYSLTTSSTEGGSVKTPGEGISVHAANTTVDLVAQPYEGYQFAKWTGDVSTIADVNAASTTIAMNASYSITATFETLHPEPVALLTVSSTAGGSVTTPGEGIFLYPLGTEVSLVAKPDEGRQFANWSGDVDTIDNVDAAQTTITMDSSYSITANFCGCGSGCFIATAAYGTPMAEEIGILREFRDEYLLTNPVGEALVEFYYRVSPPIAEFITEHPSLKSIVRAGLMPAVAMSTVAVNTTPAKKISIIGLLVLLSAALAIWATTHHTYDLASRK